MSKEKTSLNLNVNKDDSNINDFIYCWDKFKSRPNKIVLHTTYSTKLFLNIVEKLEKSKNVFTEIIPDSEDYIINDKVLIEIQEDIYLSYIIIDKKLDSSIITDVVFYYKSTDVLNDVSLIIDDLNVSIVDFQEEESYNLNTINFNSGSLEIEPIEYLDIDDDNLELYYSHKTFKNINKLIKKIKKQDKGLSILWGERGTGKTSIINYLADKINRIVIFIPNNLIDLTINNPDFRKFIKRHNKPLIIIDDCEMIFNEFFTKSNMVANNLVQLVDGYLSDNLKINIITIFNVEDESEIDHTLLDCNNLLDTVEFSSLDENESNDLSKHLGQKTNFKNKNRTIDVIKKNTTNDQKKIGF